jgi:cobalt-zinc-cadmium efflux system protein
MNNKKHQHHDISGKNLFWTIFLNVSITIAEIIGGIISGSMALLTDALHNFSDVLSLIISYIANRLTRRKATVKQTFGYKRSEIIAAFLNSVTLIILASFILEQAILRFWEPTKIIANWVIYLSIASIVANALSVLLIKKDAKDNMNIKSASLHLLTDMLTSVAVLIGGLSMKFMNWYWVDSVLSIIIVIYLIYMSWGIFKSSLQIIMQFTPDNINVYKIVIEIKKINNIKNIHHVHIWQINEHDIMFEAHVDLMEDSKITDFETVLKKIKQILAQFNIEHTIIQPEFSADDNKQIINKN